jgi:S1-C subfamily serine protease
MPNKLAALLCVAGSVALASCAPLPTHTTTPTITLRRGGSYQPPPDAVPAPVSIQAGNYDYSGMPRVILNGQVVAPADAIGFTIAQNALVLGQVPALPNPRPGRLHIVVPDHDRLLVLAPQALRNAQPATADWQVEILRAALHQEADATLRAQAFASGDVVEQNDTVWPDADGADYVLWFQVQSARPNNAGPWNGSWQLRRANGSTNLAVSSDPGAQWGPQRLLSFARSVQDSALALNGSPAALAAHIGPRGPGHPFSNGSGIVVDRQGHILTNNHVIANCADMRVNGSDNGIPVGARLIANDAKLDLALIQIGKPWPEYARFRDSQTLRPGESLVATGFPLTGLVSPEMAVTTGSLTTLSGMQGNADLFQFSAPVQPGNSGGPVLDSAGRVVGITDKVLNGLALAMLMGGTVPQNVNFAIKSDVARDYLANFGVRLDEAAGTPGEDAATVGETARRFTVKVSCWR